MTMEETGATGRVRQRDVDGDDWARRSYRQAAGSGREAGWADA
jgi:hypothetical protein